MANHDLKLENLLLVALPAARPLKIGDFSYSKHEMDSSPKSTIGTLPYMWVEAAAAVVADQAVGL